ncbi:MAG: hypothetical protein V4706_14955, partial [Pseudomonadota bacterium]
ALGHKALNKKMAGKLCCHPDIVPLECTQARRRTGEDALHTSRGRGTGFARSQAQQPLFQCKGQGAAAGSK